MKQIVITVAQMNEILESTKNFKAKGEFSSYSGIHLVAAEDGALRVYATDGYKVIKMFFVNLYSDRTDFSKEKIVKIVMPFPNIKKLKNCRENLVVIQEQDDKEVSIVNYPYKEEDNINCGKFEGDPFDSEDFFDENNRHFGRKEIGQQFLITKKLLIEALQAFGKDEVVEITEYDFCIKLDSRHGKTVIVMKRK